MAEFIEEKVKESRREKNTKILEAIRKKTGSYITVFLQNSEAVMIREDCIESFESASDFLIVRTRSGKEYKTKENVLKFFARNTNMKEDYFKTYVGVE